MTFGVSISANAFGVGWIVMIPRPEQRVINTSNSPISTAVSTSPARTSAEAASQLSVPESSARDCSNLSATGDDASSAIRLTVPRDAGIVPIGIVSPAVGVDGSAVGFLSSAAMGLPNILGIDATMFGRGGAVTAGKAGSTACAEATLRAGRIVGWGVEATGRGDGDGVARTDRRWTGAVTGAALASFADGPFTTGDGLAAGLGLAISAALITRGFAGNLIGAAFSGALTSFGSGSDCGND